MTGLGIGLAYTESPLVEAFDSYAPIQGKALSFRALMQDFGAVLRKDRELIAGRIRWIYRHLSVV